MNRPRLVVDVVADPVCPWCYVGLASMLAAKSDLSTDHETLIRFRPYQLNPATPPGGIDRQAYYAARMADPGHRAAQLAALKQAGSDAGLQFDPMAPAILPNTANAHRVIRWAHFAGRQEETARTIYKGYWEEGADIGGEATLAALAGRAGLDRDEIAQRLATTEDAGAIDLECRRMRQAGVSGVPTFIVNESIGFSGALAPAKLAAAIREAGARSRERE